MPSQKGELLEGRGLTKLNKAISVIKKGFHGGHCALSKDSWICFFGARGKAAFQLYTETHYCKNFCQ